MTGDKDKFQVIQLVIEKAEPLAPASRDASQDPPADPGSAGGSAEARAADEGGLPVDCPVTPLGVEGDDFYYLDTIKRLRVIDQYRHGRNPIAAMFASVSARHRLAKT